MWFIWYNEVYIQYVFRTKSHNYVNIHMVTDALKVFAKFLIRAGHKTMSNRLIATREFTQGNWDVF